MHQIKKYVSTLGQWKKKGANISLSVLNSMGGQLRTCQIFLSYRPTGEKHMVFSKSFAKCGEF